MSLTVWIKDDPATPQKREANWSPQFIKATGPLPPRNPPVVHGHTEDKKSGYHDTRRNSWGPSLLKNPVNPIALHARALI